MDSSKDKKLKKFTEFETKYKIDTDRQYEFKDLVEKIQDLKDFCYVEGPDVYWTKGKENFQRFRRAAHDKNGKAWLTNKFKSSEANNNIRLEHNIRVDKTPDQEIASYVESLGFKYNFTIYKNCHIYRFADATLVYYSVRDEKGKRTNFIEIEVDEATIDKYTENEAWEIVKKYEKVLEPLGIKAQNRLRKSLFEMYRREI